MRRQTHAARRGSTSQPWNPSLIPNSVSWFRADRGLTASYLALANNSSFDSWGAYRASCSANTLETLDPDGGNAADKIIEDTTAASLHILAQTPTNWSSDSTYTTTQACSFKAATRTQAIIRNNTGQYAIWNLTDGTLFSKTATVTAPAATSQGNGWWRCSMSYPTTAGVSIYHTGPANGGPSYNGDGSSYIYAYNAQMSQTPTRISAWADQVAAGGFSAVTQATASNQPYITSADASYRNRPSINWDGSSDFLASGAASQWKHLHDGGGTTLYMIHRYASALVDHTLFDTCDNISTNVGITVLIGGVLGRYTVNIANGAASYLVSTNTAGASTAINTNNTLIVRHSTAGSPQWVVRHNGSTLTSGAYTGAASAANPTYALSVGKGNVALNRFNGSCVEFGTYNRYLTDAECAQIETYKTARYG